MLWAAVIGEFPLILVLHLAGQGLIRVNLRRVVRKASSSPAQRCRGLG
jgi:hypothetical protein